MNKDFNTFNKFYNKLQKSLRKVFPESVIPDFELKYKAGLAFEINRLAAQKNALILKHNYMEPVLFYAVNGFKGDSLELSKKAAETKSDVIIFCGVHFMAETAKILNPNKKVLIPSLKAGCSLANGITKNDVLKLKKRFPNLPVITYVNSTAETKAVSDVCCTSGNALKVVTWALKEFNTKSIIFIPDKYMAENIAKDTGMDIYFPTKDKNIDNRIDYKKRPTIIGWNARCYVHEQYTINHVKEIRKDYENAIILAHPECKPEVVSVSDFSGSTSAMAKYVEKHGRNKKIALLTECSMTDNLLAAFPKYSDNLIRMCNLRCRYMNMITLDQLRNALLNNQYEIKVPEKTRKKAEVSVKRMISIS
ncbi:MAG: quinolinate synthase NadA [Patescibacteria group bacterium]|nr:quinolinate synthase NadA [Patescibacteria group bacterium]